MGFVVQSSKPRLTPTQRYIYDLILGLFGKNIGENIVMLFTFSDGNEPKSLSAVKVAAVPFINYFTFNNVDIYDSNHSEINEIY